MGISCHLRCRGDGKLYSLISSSVPENMVLGATCSNGSVELPCNIVSLEHDQYVAVVVDFDSSQRLDFFLESKNGGVREPFGSLHVNPRRYSLASKINGILRTDLCNSIRNIDSSGIKRELPFTCDGFVPSPDGLLARGEIAQLETGEIQEIVAFDSQANIVGRSSVFLNEDAVAKTGCSLIYSIEVPHNLKGLCLAAVGSSGRYVSAVKAYKQKQYKKMLDSSLDFFCHAAEDPRYLSLIHI